MLCPKLIVNDLFQQWSQEEEDKEAVGTVEKQKNWSSVNLAFQALVVSDGS